MNPHFKGSDFFCLVGEFKSNFSSMHKQVNNLKMGKKRVVFQEQTDYFEGAIFRKKVDSVNNVTDLLQNYLEALNANSSE